MYNGIGLQTARGSGTNGYVQTNKFFVRPKTNKVVVDSSKGFGPDQGTGGIGKKANKDILEHDRKRQIELKLTVLEDKLTDQGYSDAEIAEKLKEARAALEAADAVACMDGGNITTEKNVSDTQTHQIAAWKEKQLETLRAALGIQLPEAKEEKQVDLDVSENDDEPKNYKKDSSEGDGDFEEGEIMHREDGRGARSRREIEDSKIEKKFDKKSRGHVRNGKGEEDRKPKKEARKGMHREDVKKRDFSSGAESDSKHSSGSDDDSSFDTKRKRISQRKSKKSRAYSSDSSSRSDDSDGAYGKRGRKRQIHENKKPVQRGKQSRKERDYSVSSDSDSVRVKGREADSDVDIKRKHKSVKSKKSKSKINDDSDSDYSSDYVRQVDKRRADDFMKPPRRHDSDSDSDAEIKTKHRTGKPEKVKSVQRGKQSGKEKHYSVSSDSDSARGKVGEADSDFDIKGKHRSAISKKSESRINDSSDDMQQVDKRRSDDFVKPPRRHDSDSDSDAETKKHRTEKLEKMKSSFSVVADYHGSDSEREHHRRGPDKSKKAQKRHELDYGSDLETKRKDEREKSKIVSSKVASVSDHYSDDLERDHKRKSEKSVKAPTKHDPDGDFDSRERFAGRSTQRDDFPVKRRRHDSDDDESGEATKTERALQDSVRDKARVVEEHKGATRGRSNEDDGYRSRARLEDRDYKRHRRNDGEYEDKEPVDDITASRRSSLEYERKHVRGVDDYDYRRERQDRRGGGDYRRDGDDLTNGNKDDKEHKRKREDERSYGRDRREEHGSKERGTREVDHHGSRRYDRDHDSSKRSRHEDSRHRERGDDRWRA